MLEAAPASKDAPLAPRSVRNVGLAVVRHLFRRGSPRVSSVLDGLGLLAAVIDKHFAVLRHVLFGGCHQLLTFASSSRRSAESHFTNAGSYRSSREGR